VTAIAPNPVVTSRPPVPAVPPLLNGDHLGQEEFLRRYKATPPKLKAELIQGRVYVASPVSARDHGEPHADVITWLGVYRAATPGVIVGDNATTVLGPDDVPQPDAYLRLDPTRGGQAELGADGYVYGVQELIVEVAATSAGYDLHEKLETYRDAGVKEHFVWRTYDGEVDRFMAGPAGTLTRCPPDADGVYRSVVFPGLWLDPAALVRGDLAGVLRVAQQGMASPEHAAFVARPAGNKGST
jgi:hypothetical protein